MRLPPVVLFGFLCFSLLTACRPDPPVVELSEDMFVPAGQEQQRERTLWQKPGLVIEAMGDVEEKVIADIGAGQGYFAQRLAPLADRVIAIDIDPQYISYLDTLRQTELPPNMQSRLEPRLARPDEPNLRNNEGDIILIVNTVAYLRDKTSYLRKLMPALRQNGRVVIVDWKKKRTSEGPAQNERIALFQLENHLQEAGFEIVRSDDTTLDYQYIVVAGKPD